MKKLLLCLVVFAALPLAAQSHFDVSYEISNYTYREPDGNLPISLKGHLQGAYLRYENRVDGSPYYFAVDGRWMGGTTDYDGWLMNGTKHTADDIGDYYYEAALHMGRAVDLTPQMQVFGTAGFGYRYLKDHMNKDEAGYLRESNYVYMPFAAELRYDGGAWGWALKGQLDYLIFGWQNSHLGGKIRNDQHEGFGLRVSAKAFLKLGDGMSLFAEPFFRYWDIQESESQYAPAVGKYIVEPHNTTEEYGLRFGVTF